MQVIWEEMYSYMRGQAATAPRAATEGEEAKEPDQMATLSEIFVPDQSAVIQTSATEMERLGVAYSMGRGGSRAVRQLATLLRDEREHVRRAAGYGLTVSGADGVEPLLALLADPAPLLTAAAALQERGLLGPDMCQHCKVRERKTTGRAPPKTQH